MSPTKSLFKGFEAVIWDLIERKERKNIDIIDNDKNRNNKQSQNDNKITITINN